MLGHKAFQVLSTRVETFAAFRCFDQRLRETMLFPRDRVIDGVDARDLDSVARAFDAARPDCVLNCIGIIKQLKEATQPKPSILINALFPHLLADLCAERGTRLIHLSTDCVFSGARGDYVESDLTDPVDLYGRTKLVGEVSAPHVLTIRTSMIGRELFSSVSLVEWFLRQGGAAVRGYTNARFSGLTTIAVAAEIGRVIAELPQLTGIYHVSGPAISKYDLLLLLREAYGVPCEIEPYDDFRCDRTLRSDRYRSAAGFAPASWPAMVAEMRRDATPYDLFRA
jgi:dTDP-4-dehydrorhamnose reductase